MLPRGQVADSRSSHHSFSSICSRAIRTTGSRLDVPSYTDHSVTEWNRADGHLFKSLAATHEATLFVESRPVLAIKAAATAPNLKKFSKHMQSLTKVDLFRP